MICKMRALYIPAVALLAMADPAIPNMPNDYSTRIEVTDELNQQTSQASEWVDYTGDRERFDRFINGETLTDLLLFDKKAHYKLYGQQPCSIANTTAEPFGRHVPTAKRTFSLDHPGGNYSYLGLRSVRGIAADLWRLDTGEVAVASPGSNYSTYNYTALYYFMSANWTNTFGPARPPLRMEWLGNSTDENGVRTPFHATYDFYDFTAGRPDSSIFSLSDLVIARNKICPTWEHHSHQAIPSLPDTFQANIEANIVERNYSLERRDYFDGINNRMKEVLHTSDGGLSCKITTFDASSGHVVSSTHTVSPSGICTTSTTEDNRRGQRFFNVTSGHMFHTAHIFGESGNYSYLGRAEARGIACDEWIKESSMSFRNIVINFTLQYFFTAPGWTIHSSSSRDAGSGSNRVPVRVLLRGQEDTGKKFVHYYDFVAFIGNAPSEADFSPPSECVVYDATASESDAGKGGPALMVTLAVVLSLVFGLVGGYYYGKRTAAARSGAGLASGLEMQGIGSYAGGSYAEELDVGPLDNDSGPPGILGAKPSIHEIQDGESV